MDGTTPSDQPYASGIILATCSIITMLLIQPPLFWHLRNRNIGASVLIAWLSILLLFNFINAILWPADNWQTWYHGVGLCDIEIRVQLASEVALPASLACILRALAVVMDTERAIVMQTKAQKRRGYVIDCIWCIGLPLLQMLFHYVVQSSRYYIYGISGCVSAVDNSWLSIVLLEVPVAIWLVADVYFAILILIRLYRYRLSFGSILARNNTTRSRFLRLYILCIICVICTIPSLIYFLYWNSRQPLHSFSWSETHATTTRNEVILVRSYGQVLYDRWIYLAIGILVVVFFGLGREAGGIYCTCLLALRLDKVFLRLNPENRSSETSTNSSLGKKAKALFKRTSASSLSTWTSSVLGTTTSTKTDSQSYKQRDFLGTEPQRQHGHEASETAEINRPVCEENDTTARTAPKPTLPGRITSFLHPRRIEHTDYRETFQLANISGEPLALRSEVSGGGLGGHGSLEVIVRKEVRQGSEHAETVPKTFYHAS